MTDDTAFAPESVAVASVPAPRALNLLVRQIRLEARDVLSFELVDPQGAELPRFTAGAHVDVFLPDGQIRQYSLSNDPAERHRYVVGVLREESGRGGSRRMHEHVRVGDMLAVSEPRNHFRLAEGGGHAVLLAGGIGITPLKAMAHELHAAGRSFELHYLSRGPHAAAFVEELRTLETDGHLHLHFDGGDATRRFDVRTLLDGHAGNDSHVYFCGPPGLMQACTEATLHWDRSRVHSEHFVAPAGPTIAHGGDTGPTDTFEVELARSGRRLSVGPGQSIVEALRDGGVAIDTSCESGLCATCKLRYLSGTVEHRDYVLDEEEQRHYLTACVSRAAGLLVLDL